MPENTELRILAMCPQFKTNICTKSHQYPFSYSHVIAAVLREVNKSSETGTMAGKPIVKTLSIISGFINTYKDFKFDKKDLAQYGLYGHFSYFPESKLDDESIGLCLKELIGQVIDNARICIKNS